MLNCFNIKKSDYTKNSKTKNKFLGKNSTFVYDKFKNGLQFKVKKIFFYAINLLISSLYNN